MKTAICALVIGAIVITCAGSGSAQGRRGGGGGGGRGRGAAPPATVCSSPEAFGMSLGNIETLLTLTDGQKTALDALRAKVDQASNSMATVCDATPVFTVNGELAASQKELAAAVVVVRAILPAEQKFYGTLTADQKTQFDELVSWPTF